MSASESMKFIFCNNLQSHYELNSLQFPLKITLHVLHVSHNIYQQSNQCRVSTHEEGLGRSGQCDTAMSLIHAHARPIFNHILMLAP